LIAIGIPAVRVVMVPEALANPQVKHRELCKASTLFQESIARSASRARASRSQAPIQPQSPPPPPGEHSEEMLRGLGCGPADIADLLKLARSRLLMERDGAPLPRVMVPGRNDPCPCGSGKKYKRCHGLLPAAAESPMLPGPAPAAPPGQALLDAAQRCVETGEMARAESLYRELLEREPDHVDASTALGSLLDALGRVDEAEAIFRRLVETDAPTATAYCNHGVMLYKQGRAREAAETLQRAVSMQPGYAIALDNLGAALTTLGRLDEAEQSIRAALAIDDRIPSAHNSLGTLLARRHDDAALACFDRALAIDPTFFDAHVQRATLLREQGRIADAVMAWRRAMTLAPATLPVWSNLVHTMLYSDEISAEEVMVWHRRFDKVLELSSDGGGTAVAPRRSVPAPASRLRIGFISPDFRRHPVGDFTEQLFEHHDRSQMEVICYHDSVVDDDVGAELASHAARWVKTSGLKDDELAAQIAGDRLDVLIDLADTPGCVCVCSLAGWHRYKQRGWAIPPQRACRRSTFASPTRAPIHPDTRRCIPSAWSDCRTATFATGRATLLRCRGRCLRSRVPAR
jgi:tetratricopeptide (TPR) repeat protein